MFMRICLLLLFLIGNAFSSEIETTYRVLPTKGALSRRADVEFICDLSYEKENSSRNFVLTVEREEKGAVLTLSFRGKGIKIFQQLRNGQKVQSASLEQIDPLSGDVVDSKKIKFSSNRLEIQGLKPGYIYRLKYKIIDKSPDLRILTPKVSILDNIKKEIRENGVENYSLKFTIPVFFSAGSYSLDKKAKYLLEGLRSLKEICKVKIIGYADSSQIVKAKVPSNKELAKLRAESVKNYLSKQEQ